MFSSVKERRKNSPFFYKYYFDVCKLQNVAPISFPKHYIDKNILDICGDKVMLNEWFPIFEALKTDRSLQFIAIRSKHTLKKVAEEVDSEAKARLVKKLPVLYTRFILRMLMTSLSECIKGSPVVTCVELEGLPLKHEYTAYFSKDISTNTTLQTISFHGCSIGDDGCKQLNSCVRNMPSVFHLDLSNCNLSSRSAIELGEILKYQSLQRYSEGWKQSLRNHDPNLEAMPGIRRIILNNNSQIGDEGIRFLMEVLKEDIWLKAIDLQNCGISNVGAQCVLDMLGFNTSLYIVDVRDNMEIDDNLVHQIMLKLLYNNSSKDLHEYSWTVPLSQLSSVTQSPNRLNRNVSLNQALNVKQKTLIKDKSSLFQYVPQLMETKQQLKEVMQHLEVETSLRRKAELKQEELKNKINELECELLKEKEEKEGFCLIKVEAYEAVVNTLRKFSIFIEDIKDTNEIHRKEEAHDSNNGTECLKNVEVSLEADIQNILKVTTKEEQNKEYSYPKNIPQEMKASLEIRERAPFQNNNFDMWMKDLQEQSQNRTHSTTISEIGCNIVSQIFEEFLSRLEMNYESKTSSVMNEVTKVNDCIDPATLSNCFNSSSKVKEIYEQFIELNASKMLKNEH